MLQRPGRAYWLRPKIIVLGVLFLLLIPAFLVAVNVPPLLAKNLPKDFWKNPINKLKGGTPYALSLALTGTALMILAQF